MEGLSVSFLFKMDGQMKGNKMLVAQTVGSK